MKLLILGGTGFVGRILTENLTWTNHDITLFNRGKRNSGLFPEVKRITGDRETDDINKIASEEWDVVIDFSCMQPFNLEKILALLKGKVKRYIFVSSASVYHMEDLTSPFKENDEIYSCTEEEKMSPDVMTNYAQKKSECERILLMNDWVDGIIFRPSLIYGRYDPTDRFYYWLYRVKTQPKILLPENGKRKFTNTYSEDFANIIQEAITIQNHRKIYNACTHEPVSLKHYLDIAIKELGTNPELINADKEFLEKKKVTPWGDIPMWIPDMDLILDRTRLDEDFKVKLKDFDTTVKESIKYYDSLGWQIPKYGLSLEKERNLLNELER